MTPPKRFLGLETSCDETAAAVFTDEPRILSSVVASQHQVHAPYGGVVPELAARAHLRNLLPVIRQALADADTRLEDLAAIAVHNRPGLVGALVVGVSAAKMLSALLKIPLLGVSHLEGHVYACQLAAGRDIFPCVALMSVAVIPNWCWPMLPTGSRCWARPGMMPLARPSTKQPR